MEDYIIAMFNAKESKEAKIMKFNGEINQIHICALLDSDSTYSFMHPSEIKEKKMKLTQTTPLIVTNANGLGW
jgi:hypothetical protein